MFLLQTPTTLHQLPRTMDCFFLHGTTAMHPLQQTMDCFFLQVATAMQPLPRTMNCFFLQGATDMPDGANYGLPFCRRHMALLCHAHLRTFFKENARRWLGAVSVAKRLTENACRCLLVKIEVLALRFAGKCSGVQR